MNMQDNDLYLGNRAVENFPFFLSAQRSNRNEVDIAVPC